MTKNQTAQASSRKIPGLIRHTSREPVRTIASAKGQPYLLLGTTSNYGWEYNDKGSGAHADVTIWKPLPDADYHIIGYYAQGNYGEPTGLMTTVRSVNDPDNSLLQPPTGYREIWNDHGSGGHNDGSIWYPVPPADFVSLGFVCVAGYNEPSIPSYRCVHRSQVAPYEVEPPLIWKDAGSGAHKDVAIYADPAVPGIFVAQGNYKPFSGTVYQFRIA